MPFGRPVSSMEQRLRWLREHPEVWQHAKLIPMDGGSYRFFLDAGVHRRIVRAMKLAGLFAATTYELDVPVHRYIRILRGLR